MAQMETPFNARAGSQDKSHKMAVLAAVAAHFATEFFEAASSCDD
jgi:hypothetical protein